MTDLSMRTTNQLEKIAEETDKRFKEARNESQEREAREWNKARAKIDENEDHFERHWSPKVKKRRDEIKRDQNYTIPDKLEVLKDENIQLKKHKVELETDIKVIGTQLQRMIRMLNSDKVLASKELDNLIEEQIRLREEELNLNKRVKNALKKQGQSHSKNTKPVFEGESLAKPKSISKTRTADLGTSSSAQTFKQEHQLKILKEQLSRSNTEI